MWSITALISYISKHRTITDNAAKDISKYLTELKNIQSFEKIDPKYDTRTVREVLKAFSPSQKSVFNYILGEKVEECNLLRTKVKYLEKEIRKLKEAKNEVKN